MFYIKEFYFRSLYFLFVIVSIILTLYYYREGLFLFFLIPNFLNGYVFIENLIYTYPGELFYALINLNLLTTFFLAVPYLSWIAVDFFKSSLFLFEYAILKKYTLSLNIVGILFNIIIFTVFFPIMYNFFATFNPEDLNIRLELKIQDFIAFIITIFYLINISLIFITTVYTFLLIKGVVVFFKYRKFFVLLNLLLATLLSNPEINSQLTLFLFLEVFINLFAFFLVYNNKINKATY